MCTCTPWIRIIQAWRWQTAHLSIQEVEDRNVLPTVALQEALLQGLPLLLQVVCMQRPLVQRHPRQAWLIGAGKQ